MNIRKALDGILPQVRKPARYTGGEFNMAKKDLKEVNIRFAFCFPDVYEVGMSHLGLNILYHLLNQRTDTYVERVFAPWPDMQDKMKTHHIPLYSLETYTPLNDFDMVGFNLSYEMCYTNVLSMLELGGIPVYASERPAGRPVVIAGGACVYNPEPMSAFIDVFIIGEGEAVSAELLDAYRTHRKKGWDKQAFLREAAGIPGVYVPALYGVTYLPDGRVENIRPKQDGVPEKVEKRFVADLDAAYFPEKPIVPFLNVVHDRITLEIFRGCTRGCRFCQAGFVYRPVREKSLETLLGSAKKIVHHTGWDEISLCSLSSGDYSRISGLSRALIEAFDAKKVSVSLPSLRADAYAKNRAGYLNKVRKTGLTFAPEAGTQRLRDIINKNVTEADLLNSVQRAFQAGFHAVKLYFMIGLPEETMDDVAGIADLVAKVRETYYGLPAPGGRGRLSVTVSTSCFVPKPCTPFQWRAQDDMKLLNKKQQFLRERLKQKDVKYNWHDSRLSFLEAVFARGDRRLAGVLHQAFKNGAKFDAWNEYFDCNAWEKAFQKKGVNPAFYASRKRAYAEILPWAHIRCGVSETYLKEEDEKAGQAAVTADCRRECKRCGLEGVCRKHAAADEI